jgi:POT family proton-dependent oligopeptide transporter
MARPRRSVNACGMVPIKTQPDPNETRWPPGIPYIIGNEGCERFSFYGMKAILFVYLSQLFAAEGANALQAEHHATEVVHTFVAGVYALPLVGALLADRLLGKYRTILWLSLFYCAGHACLAVFEDDFTGFALGLTLISIGAGGIKPCVSAHVGDQFGKANLGRLERVYQGFYFIVNLGALLSTLLIPWIKGRWGFAPAFALPGVLMGLATFTFWLGRHEFVHVPARPGGALGALDALSGTLLFASVALPLFGSELSSGYADLSFASKLGISVLCLSVGFLLFLYRNRREQDDGFLAVLWFSLRERFAAGASSGDLFAAARARFGEEAAAGPAAVLRMISVFAMVSIFWALFDQHASSWTAQAREMDRTFSLFGTRFELLPEQIAAANPALVMLLVPLMSYLVYPAIERLGIATTPLRRMTAGMFLASLSFVIVALAQARLDAGVPVHIGVQLLAFAVLTTAEVMVSVTGLEFAYTQAPRRMKSLLMGFWALAVSLGNLLVALLSRLQTLPRVQFFWVFAGLMLAAAALFGLRAAFYRYQTYTQ